MGINDLGKITIDNTGITSGIAALGGTYTSSPEPGIITKTLSPALKAGEETFTSAFTGLKEATTEAFKPELSTPQRIANLLHLAGSGANVLFSPINAAFSAAEAVPALKYPAELLQTPFMITGILGKFGAEKFINALPISQENKDILRPSFEEIGTLAGQIILGGRIMKFIGQGEKLNKTVIDKTAEEIKTEIPEAAATKMGMAELGREDIFKPNPLETPTVELPEKIPLPPETTEGKPILPEPYEITPETQISLLKEQISNMEEALKENPASKLSKYANRNRELPEVLGGVYGKKGAKSEFGIHGDSIVTELGFETAEDAEMAYEKYKKSLDHLRVLKNELKQLKTSNFKEYSPKQLEKINFLFDNATRGVNEVIEIPRPLVPIGEGRMLKSRLGLRVRQSAIEQGFKETFGRLPEYRQANFKEQARLISEIPSEAIIKMALGQEIVPSNILPELIYKTADTYAKETRNGALLKQLAHSPIVSEATAMGQRIRALREYDAESPAKAIKEIDKIHEEKAKGKTAQISKETAELKNEIKKGNTRQSWAEFIKSIEC